MSKLVAALKDPKTSIPGLIVLIFTSLNMAGITLFPAGVQEAIVALALILVGVFAGGIADWSTTIPAAIYAIITILTWLGLTLPPHFSEGLAYLCLGLYALLTGQPLPPKPTTSDSDAGAIDGR